MGARQSPSDLDTPISGPHYAAESSFERGLQRASTPDHARRKNRRPKFASSGGVGPAQTRCAIEGGGVAFRISFEPGTRYASACGRKREGPSLERELLGDEAAVECARSCYDSWCLAKGYTLSGLLRGCFTSTRLSSDGPQFMVVLWSQKDRALPLRNSIGLVVKQGFAFVASSD